MARPAILGIFLFSLLVLPLRGAAAPDPLALPTSLFPRGAKVSVRAVEQQQATTDSRLRTGTVTGWARGLEQIATWSDQNHYLSLRYLASTYTNVADAVAVRSDAVATLWAAGTLCHSNAFCIRERDGHRDVVRVLRHGPVEIELTLRVGARVSGKAEGAGVALLQRAAQQATALAARVPTVTDPPSDPLPPIAPAGTGPVITAPSLLVLAPAALPGMHLYGGTYRSGDAWLLRRAIAHPTVELAGGLSTYVEDASIPGGRLYDAAVLYPTVAAATGAFVDAQNANLDLSPSNLSLPGDASAAWQDGNESIALLRDQNVLLELVGSGKALGQLPAAAAAVVAAVPTPLHAAGTQIVRADGTPIRLVGFSWYGMESVDDVVGGLDYQPYETILAMVRAGGYNTIRIPLSNQVIEQNPVVTTHLNANPDLVGLHALDILDRIVDAAGALGLSVILDDHRSDAGWSAEAGGLWYTAAYPQSAWLQDWTTLATRYADNDTVVGFDLRNEPHDPATWGDGNPATDWRLAAQAAGNAVLAIDPHVLILVEGIQTYQGNGGWWGGNLMGVATAPVQLNWPDGSSAQSQLVYSPHDYGPKNCGTNGCPQFNSTTTPASLQQIWEQHWGYITDNPSAPYAAPLWLGEFGTCNNDPSCGTDTTPGSQGQWFSALVQYIGTKGIGWAYWPLHGTRSTAPLMNRVYGQPEGFGYLQPDWATTNAWLDAQLATIRAQP